MSNSPRLGFTELPVGVNASETAINENDLYLEQGAGFFIVLDKGENAPPGSPAQGEAHIVGAAPTGAWTGHEDDIAFYLNTSWRFITPIEGTRADVNDEDVTYRYSGTAWAIDTAVGALLPANNLSDVASAATARANLGVQFIRLAGFATTAPSASEVLLDFEADIAFTLVANLSGSRASVGTNPAATFALDVKKNGSTIATISISTSGVATLTTVGGTSKSIIVGDIVTIIAPATPDASIARLRYTLQGTL